MVTQFHLNKCVWSDGNAFCHLICCCWSSSGMRENDVYIRSDTKARLYGPRSARLPLINHTVGVSQGASCACFDAVMLDSLNRTAGMMSIQWQNKQRFQTGLSLTCVIAEAASARPGINAFSEVEWLFDWPEVSEGGRGGLAGNTGEGGNDGPLPSASLPRLILQFLPPPLSLFFDAVLLRMHRQLTSLCS